MSDEHRRSIPDDVLAAFQDHDIQLRSEEERPQLPAKQRQRSRNWELA